MYFHWNQTIETKLHVEKLFDIGGLQLDSRLASCLVYSHVNKEGCLLFLII